VNAVRPDTIKNINESGAKFKLAENVTAFVSAARFLGVQVNDTFASPDLVDERNIPKVLVCIHAFADAIAAQGATFSPLPKEGLADLQAAATSISLGAKKEYSTLFEQKQAESQALYKNAHKGSIVKSDAAPVNTGLSFHEAQQQKAQKNASSATNYSGRNIVQSGAGQGAQSVLSYSDAKNAENSKQFAGLGRTNSIVKSSEKSVGSGLSFSEAKQAEAQKNYTFGNINRNVQSQEKAVGSGLSYSQQSQSDAQKRGQNVVGNHIVRSEDAGSQSSLSMADTSAAAAQKIISETKTLAHSVVRSEAGAGSQSSLSMADTRATEAQKMTSSAKSSGHNIVRLDGHAVVEP